MNRPTRIAIKLAMPILIFTIGEFVARNVIDLRGRMASAERKTLSAYQGEPWANQYLKDLRDCAAQSAHAHQPRYARYVLQIINEDCATPTVNYAHRLRKTWNPAPGVTPPGSAPKEIGFFGGSTMEGLGAIDDETIPSRFSHLVNEAGRSEVYHVTNYGVAGYTFTQSVMRLIALLQEGKHLDAVIFYNGANDIDYAYWGGEAGELESENMVRTRLEGSALDRLGLFVTEQINACVLCMTGGILVRHTPFLQDHITPYLVRLREAIQFKKGKGGGDDVTTMAANISDYFARSHDLLVRVADAYNIRHLEFWQPALMLDSGYGPGEAPLARQDPRLTDTKLRQLYATTRQDTLAKHLSAFSDLTHVLDGRTRAVYLDAVHLVGAGNAMVARGIYAEWTKNEVGTPTPR